MQERMSEPFPHPHEELGKGLPPVVRPPVGGQQRLHHLDKVPQRLVIQLGGEGIAPWGWGGGRDMRYV